MPIWKHQQFSRRQRRVGGAAVTEPPPGRSHRHEPAHRRLASVGRCSVGVGRPRRAVDRSCLPYVVMKPGPITNTLGKLSGKQLITVSGARPTRPRGPSTSPRCGSPAAPATASPSGTCSGAWSTPARTSSPEQLYFPKGVTDKQVEEESTAEMIDSQQEAIAVALRATGPRCPDFPLVAVVFNSRESYAKFSEGELGSGAGSIVGYYSLRTNRVTMYDLTGRGSLRSPATGVARLAKSIAMLARPSRRAVVATVVHEATHQMAFNSGLQTRFADIPLWVHRRDCRVL